jgi:tRNA(adenine34) deaminase
MDRCSNNHEYWMQKALTCAKKAQDIDEVPVGAVIVKDNKLIAQAFNQSISKNDPCAHAEVLVLRKAAKKLNNYRLNDCKLYCTLEPCMMCAGALVHARIDSLIYATNDPKTGVIDSVADYLNAPFHNHKIKVISGVLANDAKDILTKFFAQKRINRRC